MRLSGFTLNVNKCNFAFGEVRFVGHIIGSQQHRADPDKISAMQNMAAPSNKKDVRQMIGFFSYFREYIPNFAHIAEPFSFLTRKEDPIRSSGVRPSNRL